MVADQCLAKTTLFFDYGSIYIAINGRITSLPKHFSIQSIWFEEKSVCEKLYQALRTGLPHFIGGVKLWQNWQRPKAMTLWRKYARLATIVEIEIEPVKTVNASSIFAKALNMENASGAPVM